MVMESSIVSVIGMTARLESSTISVVVKTLVIVSGGFSGSSGCLALDNIPRSCDAVDVTRRRSERSGAQSLSRAIEWWTGFEEP
jgi:hypothetical protein